MDYYSNHLPPQHSILGDTSINNRRFDKFAILIYQLLEFMFSFFVQLCQPFGTTQGLGNALHSPI